MLLAGGQGDFIQIFPTLKALMYQRLELLTSTRARASVR